jgi:putative FmdB family regulatory protein
MPVYEFACLECGKEFSRVLAVREHEDTHVSCPYCQSKAIERLVTTCETITPKKS